MIVNDSWNYHRLSSTILPFERGLILSEAKESSIMLTMFRATRARSGHEWAKKKQTNKHELVKKQKTKTFLSIFAVARVLQPCPLKMKLSNPAGRITENEQRQYWTPCDLLLSRIYREKGKFSAILLKIVTDTVHQNKAPTRRASSYCQSKRVSWRKLDSI